MGARGAPWEYRTGVEKGLNLPAPPIPVLRNGGRAGHPEQSAFHPVYPCAMARLLLALLLLILPLGALAHAQPDGFGFGEQTVGPPGMGDPVLTLSASVNKPIASPGDRLVIAVVMDLVPGWHVWPNKPEPVPGLRGLTQIPTVVSVTLAEASPDGAALIGPTQYPIVHATRFDASFGQGTQIVEIKVYEGRAVAFVPVILSQDAPLGDLTFKVSLDYQACDDNECLMPGEDSATVRVSVMSLADAAAATASGGPGASPALFEGFDPAGFGAIAAGQTQAGSSSNTWEFTDFGLNLKFSTDGLLGLLAMLAIAAVGGFLLNLTPCVLPVIPIKIMGLSKSAANKKKTAVLGIIMSLGVVAFWIGIGAAISFIAGFDAISTLFQTGWFAILVGVVIGVMGLGMFGLFTIKLPQAVYRVNPRHDTPHGSFLFGVMTAVLSTPCTAPFMGSAAAWAATQDAGITLAVFGAIGAGMALPYLVLSLNPKWVKKVPKTGPASELVKQVMGILMIAVAVFFLGTGLAPFLSKPTSPPFQAFWWVVAAIVAAGGLWLAYKTFKITKNGPKRAVFGVVGIGLAAVGVLTAAKITDHGPVAWVYYTPDAMARAKADGQVVITDFTAEWCLNCKTLEAGVLHRDDVAALLNSDWSVAFKVDLTGDNPDGQALLKHYGQVAIPTLAIEGPGVSSPIVFNAYTPGQVIQAINRARGTVAPRP